MASAVLRTLIRAPATIRSSLLTSPRTLYHSDADPIPSPYRDPEAAILSAALAHVQTHGFTHQTLVLGAKDAGYLDISTNLFPRGIFELVRYHLVTQRLGLKDRVQFPSEGDKTGVGRRVRSLLLARLQGNVDTGIVGRWQQALAAMAMAANVPPSLKELGLLADEIWHLAGDTALDASWYTKRASLAGVYAATEVFQTTDQSTGFRDTEEFLDRRLEEMRLVGGAVSGTLRWAAFEAGTFVNLLRSKGVRV